VTETKHAASEDKVFRNPSDNLLEIFALPEITPVEKI